MKEKNMKLKIFFVALLFVIMPLILFNNSYALELNEEYVKEDFVYDEYNKDMVKNLSDQGKEKLKRNDGKLVIDGNLLNIGIDFWPDFSSLGIEEIEFKNVEDVEYFNCGFFDNNIKYLDLSPFKNLKQIGNYHINHGEYKYQLFKNNPIEKINFEGLDKLETIDENCFNNISIKELDFSPIKNLKKLSGFNDNQITNLDLSPLKNLENLSGFNRNNITKLDFSELQNLEYLLGFDNNNITKLDFSPLKKLRSLGGFNENQITELAFSPLENLKRLSGFNKNKIVKLDLSSLNDTVVGNYYDNEDSTLYTSYEEDSFGYNNLKSVKLNSNAKYIGNKLFKGNPDLKDIDISNCKELKNIMENAFETTNMRLHVTYKNPLGLKDAEKYYKKNEDDFYDYEKYGEYNGEEVAINGHVIVDDVQDKLDEVTEDKKLAEITTEEQAKLDEIKDIIKKQFVNEEELNKWLKEKGFDEREKKILEDNKALGEKIDAKLEEIRNLEPYAKTNEELLKELEEVSKEVEEYNKKYDELYNVYIEEIKELLAKQKTEIDKANGEKDDLSKKLEDLQAEKEKTDKLNEDTIKNLNELIAKLNKEIETNKNKISELENSVKDLQVEKTKVEAEKAMLENTLAETKDMLKAAEKNNDKASEEIMNLKNKISELEEKLAKCNEHCKKLEEELNNTKADLKNEQEENAKLNEKIKKLEAEKAELVSKNKELMEKEEERKKQEELEKSKEELEKQKEEREKRQQEAKEEREKEELENNSSVTTNTKSTNKKYTKSNNKLPYAGSESVILLSLITIGSIIYTKRVMKRK